MPNPDTSTDQREALGEAEREASREQPENFKQKETQDKIVEILPIDGEGSAIKGLDTDR